jgi:hypothetical protein
MVIFHSYVNVYQRVSTPVDDPVTSSAQELERKAKETKNMDEWRQKCGSAVWKDPHGAVKKWRCVDFNILIV